MARIQCFTDHDLGAIIWDAAVKAGEDRNQARINDSVPT